MDIQRFVAVVLLFLFSTLMQAQSNSDANPGIAFIHGTQNHTKDANGKYWKTDYLNHITDALAKPENHYIVHCNFDHYMWHKDAAGCVADQLLEFINDKNISSITVYTHSNGANVIRWILSNPTYDNRYMVLKNKISQVIALAPSSGGTPLADAVMSGGAMEKSMAWLLGYLSDAVKQQRVGDMLIYNHELLYGSAGRPSLPTPFRVVVGTDVSASPLSRTSYCNGFMFNSGLKIAKMFLNQCADGFLNCSSQEAAGEVWFYDYQKTTNNIPLSHNQTRHSCGGLDEILINDLTSGGVQS